MSGEIRLHPGDKIRDNDPRMGNRVLTIDYVGDGVRIRAGDGFRRTWIRTDRIFTDGKPRKTGFSLVAK